MTVRRGQFCSIHHSYYCCGREDLRPKPRRRSLRPRYAQPKRSSKWVLVRPGEWHHEDPRHPRGYRVRLSKARMADLVNRKVAEQNKLCAICHEEMKDLREVGADHVEPSSMGGAWRDDHPSNIAAAHNWCNFKKGSRRVA